MNVRRTMESPLGELALVADARGLRGVFLPEQAGDPRGRGATAAQHPILDQAEQELRAYFAGDRRDFTVALSPAGTAFQRRVWEALRGIPFGATRSYGALAASIGRGGAARAVGSANGQNPLAIVVPCHRVIAATGALAGYAGGLDAKRWLLAHEGRVMNEGAPQAGASAA